LEDGAGLANSSKQCNAHSKREIKRMAPASIMNIARHVPNRS
jgi:hypothetical protein